MNGRRRHVLRGGRSRGGTPGSLSLQLAIQFRGAGGAGRKPSFHRRQTVFHRIVHRLRLRRAAGQSFARAQARSQQETAAEGDSQDFDQTRDWGPPWVVILENKYDPKKIVLNHPRY